MLLRPLLATALAATPAHAVDPAPAAAGGAPGAAPVGAAAPAGAAPAAAGGDFDQPYTMQTAGAIKYAPMQGKPPTSITKRATDPQIASFPFTKATKPLPLPKFQQTQTLPVTYTAHSRVNTASPAVQPQNDMQKFLARWTD